MRPVLAYRRAAEVGRPFFLLLMLTATRVHSEGIAPYFGSSFTVTPDASVSTAGADDYYTDVFLGMAWQSSEFWTNQVRYDFGYDSIAGEHQTFSSLMFGTTYGENESFRPKVTAQATVSNDFEYRSFKLKPAIRLLPQKDAWVDLGLMLFVDSAESRALGPFADLSFYVTHALSLQMGGQVTKELNDSSTQYQVGGGPTYDLGDHASIFGNFSYAKGISSAGGNRISQPKLLRTQTATPLSGALSKDVLKDYKGSTSGIISLTAGILVVL
jgi:hypothetical protein